MTAARATPAKPALLSVCALLAAAAGCHFDRDTNAPGLSDVARAPANLAARTVEQPADPGEEMVALTPGLAMGGGVRSASPHSFGDVAVEVGLNWGENPSSHHEDDFVIYPLTGHGAVLGWSFLRFDDHNGATRTRVGQLYAEGQIYHRLLGGGLGYAVDPRTGANGPEIYGWFLSLFARTRYLFGDGGGFEITLGYQMKVPFTWVQSR